MGFECDLGVSTYGAGLFTHTAQALATGPVSAAILNAFSEP